MHAAGKLLYKSLKGTAELDFFINQLFNLLNRFTTIYLCDIEILKIKIKTFHGKMVQEKIEEAINFLHMHKKPELKGSVRQFQNHLKSVWLDMY